nr:MAG TPA: hypothetical protein [Caudoviricetes sp.]
MNWLPYPKCKPRVVATYITTVVNNLNRFYDLKLLLWDGHKWNETKWERVLAFVPAPVPPRYVPPWEKDRRTNLEKSNDET